MIQTIQAIFENGVLHPLEKLDLKEHEKVKISVHSTDQAGIDEKWNDSHPDPLEGLRIATGIKDLAENFDDYRFGRRQP